MELQTVIFDVDGTVAETADLHRTAFNRAFDDYGLGWHWDREIYSQLSPIEFSLSKLRLFSMAAKQAGHKVAQGNEHLAKIAARKAQHYCNLVRKEDVRLRPGVARLLKETRHSGLSLAAISTSTRAETQALLTKTLGFHTMGWFTCLKTSEDAGAPPTEKNLYQAVLADLGIKGCRAVAIEDSLAGATAANRCGMSVIATPSMYTASSQFDMAALTISDLGQPNEPFTPISGQARGYNWVSPTFLRVISEPNSAAA